jgi:hypothetical protein
MGHDLREPEGLFLGKPPEEDGHEPGGNLVIGNLVPQIAQEEGRHLLFGVGQAVPLGLDEAHGVHGPMLR